MGDQLVNQKRRDAPVAVVAAMVLAMLALSCVGFFSTVTNVYAWWSWRQYATTHKCVEVGRGWGDVSGPRPISVNAFDGTIYICDLDWSTDVLVVR